MSVESDRREFERAMSRASMPEMAAVGALTVPGCDGPRAAEAIAELGDAVRAMLAEH